MFTAIGAIAALYQGAVANQNAQSAKIAANAAKDAVDVAKQTLSEAQASNARQLQATIDNFHQDQRAWLGLSQPKVNLSPDKGVELEASASNVEAAKRPRFPVSRLRLPQS